MPDQDGAQQPLLGGQEGAEQITRDVNEVVLGGGSDAGGAFPSGGDAVDPARQACLPCARSAASRLARRSTLAPAGCLQDACPVRTAGWLARLASRALQDAAPWGKARGRPAQNDAARALQR